MTPATHEEVAALLGEVDSSYIDRVFDIGASLDEIGEAIDDLESKSRQVASSVRVARVRDVLAELFDPNNTPRTFPLRGVSIG